MNIWILRAGRFAEGFGARIRGLVCVALLALTLAAMPGCEKKVTQENYDLITTGAEGMTIDRVKAILGDGEKQEQTGVSLSGGFGVPGSNRSTNADTVVYLWKDNRREITVTFRDGKAIDKNKGGF